MVSRDQVHAEAAPAMIDALPQRALRGDPMTSARRGAAAVFARWQYVALTAVLALSAALNCLLLDREGYANTYYAAAVKSMLTSWKNFFFVSFDSGGFVTVDKPPLGLWVQAISAKLFGFNPLSLLLPQALAGVASVALLWWLVRRVWGDVAGLLAALALAVTPISVVASRNNTSDTVLILLLLGAVWATSIATERGHLRPLLLSGVLVGLAFNVKMLEAYIVLPALALAYLLGAPRSWRARLGHLALLGVVTLAVSLAWVVAVDLTPASARPYVGSSGTNSALSLVLGYNGLTRLTLALPEGVREAVSFLPAPIDLDVAPGNSPGVGEPGWLRLFNSGLGGQASWLLALAVAGVFVAAWSVRRRLPLDREGQSLALWGGWLLGAGGFFSVARFFHLYYLTLLGPAIAALAGIGVVALWRAWLRGGLGSWLLPAALLGTAYAQAHILSTYATWSQRLTTPIVAACLVAAAGLALSRLHPRLIRHAAPALVLAATLALLAAPLVWSAVSVQDGNGGAWLPQAGPANATGFGSGPGGAGNRGTQGGFPQQGGVAQGNTQPGNNRGAAPAQRNGGTTAGTGQGTTGQQGNLNPILGQGGRGGQGALTFAGEQWDTVDARLVQYLVANQGGAEFLVATPTSSYASVFMLLTDQPAMALGGYQGWDRILTPQQLASLVATGTVRFFYLSGSGGSFGGFGGNAGSQDATANLTAWVQSNCAAVPASAWQSATSGTAGATGTTAQRVAGGQAQSLYDCGSMMGSQP